MYICAEGEGGCGRQIWGSAATADRLFSLHPPHSLTHRPHPSTPRPSSLCSQKYRTLVQASIVSEQIVWCLHMSIVYTPLLSLSPSPHPHPHPQINTHIHKNTRTAGGQQPPALRRARPHLHDGRHAPRQGVGGPTGEPGLPAVVCRAVWAYGVREWWRWLRWLYCVMEWGDGRDWLGWLGWLRSVMVG